VEAESWQPAFAPQATSDAIQKSGDPDAYAKDMRTRVLYALGPNPSIRQRGKVRADLQRIKKSVPPALYQKYLCDLEFGKPCTAVQ
jgi:hypothetical protein